MKQSYMGHPNRAFLMRRVLALLLATTLALAGCTPSSKAADPFDPPDFTPTPAPSDWFSPDSVHTVHYVAVQPVDKDKVPAIHVELPAGQSSDLLAALPDGGCLAVSQTVVEGTETGQMPLYHPRVIRFKPDGTVALDRQLDIEAFGGYILAMCVFPDGSFSLSLRKQNNVTANGNPIDRLFRFSALGDLLWQSTDNAIFGDTPTSAGVLDRVFALADGAILAVGTVTSDKGNDISLTRFEPDGTPSNRVMIGDSEFDSLMDADYDPGTGLAILWRAESIGVGTIQRSYAGCYTERLEKRWSTVMPAGQPLYEVEAQPDGGILAVGYLQRADSSRQTLFRFDPNGTVTWQFTSMDDPAWISAFARLADGRTIAGSFRSTADGGQESILTIMDVDGALLSETDPLTGVVRQLVATADGGFMAVLRQDVRTLPQPPYISSIWTDTEAIVARYDSAQKLVWRRTIDQYKHDIRSDIIFFTSDERLLVG